MKKSFASHCHTASVRAVAASGRYVASGGADDKVFIFDMLKRQESSLLNLQRGTVTTLAFTPDTSHLFVGDSSGALIAYSTKTWELHKAWPKAHKGNAINLIRIHPSGKLAVTLGSELNMQLWNLIRGTCVNTTNLKAIPELGRIVDCIEWNASGDYLAISGAKVVQIWNTKTAVSERSFPVSHQPTCLAWIDEQTLAIGLASGHILFRKNADGATENETKEQEMFSKRLKGMSMQAPFLTTICSDGEVALFKLDEDEFGKFTKITHTNVGCRPTCVTLLDKSAFASMKPESGDDEEEEEEDVEEEQQQKKPNKRRGSLVKGSVEVIEEEEDDDEDSDEPEQPPPVKKGRKSNPGQFVMATPKKQSSTKDTPKNVPASLQKKKQKKTQGQQKLNKTIG